MSKNLDYSGNNTFYGYAVRLPIERVMQEAFVNSLIDYNLPIRPIFRLPIFSSLQVFCLPQGYTSGNKQ